MIRIGQGYDVHRLVEGRRLILGGLEVPSSVGLDGHSDADVLLHAITDAVLGAVAAGDIGQWFPPSDEAFRGADSADLLQTVMTSQRLKGWQIVNLDVTVVAQNIKLAPFISRIRQRIADIMTVDTSAVSVKATTTEKLGAIGRGEGIAALAIVLLSQV